MIPIFTVVAGANGAGKSTLTRMGREGFQASPILDPDAIANSLRATGKSGGSLIDAAREALRRAEELLAAKQSFLIETTLSGNTYLRMMSRAKAAGYLVVLIYVGTNDVSINLQRVRQRVMDGGHDEPRSHFVWSTATDDRRNGPEDVDLTLYSLRRWAQLAAKGNATALHFLFADATAVNDGLWAMVQEQRSLFLSKQSAMQFLGFAGNQLRRITGEAGRGAKGRRPEYEGIFGYDTKAAMHCLRLYLECIELMESGVITLPRPEREFLIEARAGAWTQERFLKEAERLRIEAEEAAVRSRLPDSVDASVISELIAKVYLAGWLG